MVDFQMYKVLHPEAFGAIKKHSRDRDGKGGLLSEDIGPAGDQVFLFPSRVKGYSFRSKKWSESRVMNATLSVPNQSKSNYTWTTFVRFNG
jgi:hypothetical protein